MEIILNDVDAQLITVAELNRIKSLVAPFGNYAALSETEYEAVASQFPNKVLITPEFCRKVRILDLAERRKTGYKAIYSKKKRGRIIQMFKNEMTLAEIVQKSDFAPSIVLKMVLKFYLKIKDNDVKKILSHRTSNNALKKILTNYEKVDCKRVLLLKRDMLELDCTIEESKWETRRSAQFEVEVSEYLSSLSLSFETEESLKEQYSSETKYIEIQENDGFEVINYITTKVFRTKQRNKNSFVMRIPGQFELDMKGYTPDIYFVNKRPVITYQSMEIGLNWIDCKDFVGGVAPFLDKKTMSQGLKYFSTMGTGAIILNHGMTTTFLKDMAKLEPAFENKFVFLPFSAIAS